MKARWLMATLLIAPVILLAGFADERPARTEGPPSLAGRLLVATPAMRDPRFAGTVIVMVKHGPKGALGFVVNRVNGRRPIAEVLHALGMDTAGVKGDIDIHWGGPVGGSAVVIHTRDYKMSGTELVMGGLAMTGSPKILADIGRGKGPKRALFVRGYSGWGPGQLEREIERKHWITIPGDAALIFRRNHADTWKRALKRRGVDL